MARYSPNTITDDGTPGNILQGTLVSVIASNGQLAALTDDTGAPMLNPVTIGSLGTLEFNIPDPGDLLTLQYRYGGRLVRVDNAIVGQPPLYKGDPGGNVTSIGTITDASQEAIPTGTDLVFVSGYKTPGDYQAGLSLVYDATVNVAYVATHPDTSFIDLAGRGFRGLQPDIITDGPWGGNPTLTDGAWG